LPSFALLDPVSSRRHPFGRILDDPLLASVLKFCVYAVPKAVRLTLPLPPEVARDRCTPIPAIISNSITSSPSEVLNDRFRGEARDWSFIVCEA
jgi:hypothetical protein